MNCTPRMVMLVLAWCLSLSLYGQETTGLKLVEQLLADEKLDAAHTELWRQIDQFRAGNNLDTLVDFPYLIGKVALKRSDQETAVAESEKFIDDLKNSGATARHLYEAYMNVVPFFDEAGLPQRSYEITQLALEQAEQMPDKTEREIGYVEYNLGASQLTLGDFDKAKSHFRRALEKYLNHPGMPPTKLSDAYNAMGAMMWLSSKLDSAKYYYGKAVSSLDDLENDPVNKAYLSAIVQANIGLIHLSQGNTDDAIRFTKKAIDNYQVTLNESDDESLKVKASKYQWRSMANLATIFNEMGDFQTTHNLLTYVHDQHVKELQPTDPEIPHSKMKLAQSFLNLQEYEKVISLMKKVIDTYKKAPGDHIYWEATSYFTLAKAYDLVDKIPEAEEAYNKSETYFEKALKGEYDRDFLSFLIYKAEFFAKKGDGETAINTAKKGYDLAVKIDGDNSLMAFKHGTSVAKVYYKLGEFGKALEWSEKNFSKLGNSSIKDPQTRDSLMIELQKPAAILLQSKAKYKLAPEKDEAFLKSLLADLDQTIPILERRKAINNSAQNLNLLLAEYGELFDFMKKVNLDLYKKTKDQSYLDNLLSLHESSLYTRIRARLNKRQSGFAGVPERIIAEENAIKTKMAEALDEESDATHSERIEAYFGAIDEWEKFLTSLKKDYPKYFNMRFESIVVPLENIRENIPDATTVVRYIFVDDELLALITDKDKKEIYTLDYSPVKNHIAQISAHLSDISISGPLLHELCKAIWTPFEPAIATQRIVIIPDKELFNLSFDMLTPKLVGSFAGFSENSLISKYAIAYNYSMLLLGQQSENDNFESNYIVFAPGFFDNMKADYRARISDSLNLDEKYLSLLPQPFTVDLANSMKRLFGGQAFLKENSTEATFKSNADLHRIIHIGTHAESDNLSPELSRLIFAKNPDNPDPSEDNYLYAYEVYNCRLNSKLTILTACETGKPGYQPGEGMISMAHAFNYAGSESILTGLWKIDEKSSTSITSEFYHNLVNGMSRDIALQQAKLAYVKNADGRTRSPEYWAGLVLLGDTGTISISKQRPIWYWIIGAVVILLGLLVFRRKQTA